MRTRLALAVAALAVAVAACARQQVVVTGASPAEFRSLVAGADWELMELTGQPAPTGAGGRRATIRFHADSSRAGGFAGCNRWSASYTVDGGSIRFGPIILTKMACADGMPLEQRTASALESARRFEIANDQLTLFGDVGPIARFRRAD
jgi:heat shock protein HslJ